jgi:hypothetical protein
MKTLISAAVYGLVPVPPMLDTHAWSDNNRPVTAEDVNSLQLAGLQRGATESMATDGELARIRRELENVSAELSGDRKTA